MKDKGETIENFEGFEQPTSSDTFFGVSDIPNVGSNVNLDAVIKEDLVIEEEGEETSETKNKKNPPAKKEEEEVVFESFEKKETPFEEGDEEEEEEKGKAKPNTNVKSSALSTLTFLQEKGFIEGALEDGKDYSDVEIEDMVEDAWDKSIDEAVEESAKNLPQQIKDLIKYATKGGDVNELLATMVTVASNPINKNSDIEEESVQEASVRQDLKEQGYDEEYISTQLEFLKDSGKLGAIGKKAFEKIVAKQDKLAEDKVKEIEAENNNKKTKSREFRTSLTNFVTQTKEVKGLTLSTEDSQVLPTYISEPKIQLADGRVVTELQADIYKAMGDKESLIALAKVVKSGFDFSSVKKKAVTEETRQNRRELQGKKPDVATTATSRQNKTRTIKPLWDLIGDDE